MIAEQFKIARPDGRSDRQVLFDLCKDAEAERTFTYTELIDALQEGIEPEVTRGRVCQAVASANKLLLREKQHYLRVVKNVGYRVIRGDEHLETALTKKDKAQDYLAKGKALLEHVRMDELDPNQRALHQGQLLILSAVLDSMRASERRHNKQERVLDELKARVAKLEGK